MRTNEGVMLSRRAAAVCLAAVCVAAVSAANAAVPLKTIKAWQDSAPEALDITVVLVSEETESKPVAAHPGCTTSTRKLTVTARVDAVRRTAGGLTPGQVVVFRHSVIRTGPCALPGGSFGALLSGGDRATVYLRPAESGGAIYLANDVQKLR
jgi:hypothetical protein